MKDEICTHSWVIILFIYDANIVYSRFMETEGKGSKNCIKQEKGMMFKNTIKMKKTYEI